MKRILPLLMIVILISCNNQSSEKEPEQESAVEPVLSVSSRDEDKVIQDQANPDVLTIQGAAEESTTEEKDDDKESRFLFNNEPRSYQNEDYEGGIEYFEKLVAADPENRKAYYNLGIGYFKLGKYHESLQSFNKAIAIMPRDSMSIQYRGRVYYMMGNYQQCLRDYETVVSMNPDDPIAYYNRGTAKGQLKDYAGALKDFDSAIELDDQYAEAYFNRGLANFFLGRRHEACYDWRKAHSMGHYESEKAIRNHCEGDNQ